MLKFSKKFQELLERVSYNKVSKHLLGIERLSKDSFDYNFISISLDSNRLVTFTPSDKVEKIISELPIAYNVSSIRNLTHSDTNDTIFGLIGYNKSDNEYWYPRPFCQCDVDGEDDMPDGRPACGCDKGNTGIILNEVVSPVTNKTYVLFKCLDTDRLSVVNKEAIVVSDNSDVIFTVNRNSIKVGRLVTNILTTAGIKFVAKDIEDFVNLYKASYDFATNKDIQFDIVSGESIPYWYRKERYQRGGGQLNNSCMAEKVSKVFDIYSKNSSCSMVILYSDDGILKEGSYESDKIKGRALLWDVEYNGRMIKFLDRIYCNADSDVELFKAYAKNKGWYRKIEQTMYPEAYVTLDGRNEIKDRFEVVLDNVPEYFPYMDTMCFYIEEDGKCIITNDNSRGHTREFRCTGGNYIEIENGRERAYSSPVQNDGYLAEDEVEIEDQLDNGDCDIVDAPRQRQDNVEPAVVTAHSNIYGSTTIPHPIISARSITMATEQAIGRIRRESNVAEVQSMATAEDLDRVRELIIESSRVPREYFDNIPREVEPTPPPSEPVFNLDDYRASRREHRLFWQERTSRRSDVNFGYGDGDDLPF
jgi:hypothetical protein